MFLLSSGESLSWFSWMISSSFQGFRVTSQEPDIVSSEMREHQHFTKLSKREFATTEIAYFGHIISQGVAMDNSKIDSVLQRLISSAILRKLREFWGSPGGKPKNNHPITP